MGKAADAVNLRDLLPPAFRNDPSVPIRQVRIHSPESIAAAAQQPGTLANRVLKGLVTGRPLVVPVEQQDFIDYLSRQLTKQVLDSEKKGAFALNQGTLTGVAERWRRQPVILQDSPDVRPGTSVIVKPEPKPAADLLTTIADPDREIPWTVVVHPEQWDVAVVALEQCGCVVLNADAEWTPYQ